MHDPDTPLFARDDTMLGVCHGLGAELGVSPVWFRVALALGLFWNWQGVLAGYVAAAIAINLIHWRFPLRPAAARLPAPAPASDNDDAPAPLARAA